MVTIETYGKTSNAENAIFTTAQGNATKLSSGLGGFTGVLETSQFVTKIDQAIALIDSFATLKTTLQNIKTTLQA